MSIVTQGYGAFFTDGAQAARGVLEASADAVLKSGGSSGVLLATGPGVLISEEPN